MQPEFINFTINNDYVVYSLLVGFFVAGVNGCALAPAVSFSAGKAATSTNRGVIKFENVLTNEGSGYNKDTGKFTAPYDGVYLFTWTIITRQKEAVATELYVNNVLKGYSFADARDATGMMDDSASNTLIVKMTRNQVAEIRVHATSWNTYVEGGNWSSFSGFLIHVTVIIS
ncbi:hypothetical protein KUTeg_000199 [Tegillarca granosa]|uniref:C1q domain-containing protein n=1 Tax=Tegillarca granosa TaxID=220873 RepID=A0ABQ9FWU6_TEGGR|nr:hypothetical protein KUTeg_000199 [Tegillarca granosa]